MHAGSEDSILALLELTWQFKAPICIGDTIHVEQMVQDLRESSQGDRGILTFDKKTLRILLDEAQIGIAGRHFFGKSYDVLHYL